MPSITGLNKVKAMLERKKLPDPRPVVVVGFTQNYALPVHEDLEAHHDVGQAKFLEQPARELADELRDTTAKVYAKTGSLEQGLLIAGLRLQREAQKLVPVKYGALKGSAFTALEKDAAQTSAEAKERGDAMKPDAK